MKRFIVVLCCFASLTLCFAEVPDGNTVPESGATGNVTVAPATNSTPSTPLALTAVLSGTNEVPANTSSYIGSGNFTLSGNVLTYDVAMPFPSFAPTGAGIYGPATSGTNGDLVCAWTNYLVVLGNPNSAFRGAWEYKGSMNLTADQAAQVSAGLWYVNIQSADFPDGELRGQISIPGTDLASNAGTTTTSGGDTITIPAPTVKSVPASAPPRNDPP